MRIRPLSSAPSAPPKIVSGLKKPTPWLIPTSSIDFIASFPLRYPSVSLTDGFVMRVVALIGSARDGNTKAMVTEACAALKNHATVDIFHLGRAGQPAFCDGCLSCDESGACHLADSMSAWTQKVAEADALIIGSPARWSLLSGELKTFFDRLNPLAVPEGMKGKKAIIFAVGQSSEDHGESVTMAKDSIAHFCDNAGIDVIDSVVAYDCLNEGDIQTKHPEKLDACRHAAEKLLAAHDKA